MNPVTRKTKILALAQIKGGCGKTTLSAHIAGTLAENSTVVLIDADYPQFSISNWFNAGPEKQNITLAQVGNAEQLLHAVDSFDNKVDYIVIDLAPRLENLTRAGVAVSDLTIVPVNTDMVEIWALDLTLKLMKEAEEKIEGFTYYVLPNKYRPHLENHQIMRAEIPKQFNCKIMDSTLGLRSVFPKAIGNGQLITDTRPKDVTAITEMQALIEEIKTKLEA